MARRAKLSDYVAEKGAEPANKPPDAKTKGQTLRLSPEAWHQLKLLALDKRSTSHALLIEAVNDLFRKNSKPPIA